MAGTGGKRQNAGNKKDSTRPNFFAFVSPKDITDYLDWVKANYKRDSRLAQWYGDHLFGRAVQPVEGNMQGNLTIHFDESFIKHAL